MPQFDSTLTTIFWVSILVLAGLFRAYKTGQIKIYRISPVTKKFDNPDEAIKELEELQERIKQSNKSGAQVFMVKRDKNTIAGDKPVEIKINDPEEEIKVLSDLGEKIRQSLNPGSTEKFATSSTTSTQIHFPTSVRFNMRRDPNAKPPSLLKCIVGAIICFAIGVLALCITNYERQLTLASINWPTTEGHITYSSNYFSLRTFTNYGNIEYSYTVNGQNYCACAIAYNSTWTQDHYDAPKRYPVGTIVKVYYSPNDPSRSCLEIGNMNILGQGFYWSVICFAVGLLFVFMYIKYGQSQGENSNKSLID